MGIARRKDDPGRGWNIGTAESLAALRCYSGGFIRTTVTGYSRFTVEPVYLGVAPPGAGPPTRAAPIIALATHHLVERLELLGVE